MSYNDQLIDIPTPATVKIRGASTEYCDRLPSFVIIFLLSLPLLLYLSHKGQEQAVADKIEDLPATRTQYRQHKPELLRLQNSQCAGCRITLPAKLLEVDHIYPRDKGGKDDIANLQLLCSSCNRIKGNRSQAYLLSRLSQSEKGASE